MKKSTVTDNEEKKLKERRSIVTKEEKTSETRYRRLFESAKDGILILDAETGMIVDVNPFLIDLLGYSKEEFIEKSIWEIGTFQDIYENKEKFLELQQKEYVRYEDLPLVTSDGNEIYVEFVSNVYLVNNSKVIQCNIRDITTRKRKEAILEETAKELAIVKESADELSKFTENIFDTIREPLLAIDKDLRVIKASRSFYNFFKVTPEETIGKLIYELGNHQWDIPKLKELLEEIIPEKNSFNNYEVEHNFSSIGKQVMLLNARQIQRAFGKEKVILLAIEDITERKGKEDTLKEKHRATRLTIAKGLVHLLEGTIGVNSEKGKGSKFSFTIPTDRKGAALTQADVPKAIKKAMDNVTVLVAEDDRLNYFYLKTVLSSIRCSHIHAENGVEAVEKCQRNPEIDLILMDIKMPVMNGIEATKLIRKLKPDIPIIAITAYAQTGDKQHFLEAGCTDYMAKPINKDRLIKLIDKNIV